MPKYHVARSIHINASPHDVFSAVADFSDWTTWSPWLCAEPDAKVVVSDDPSSLGATYQWEGELVGQGEMEHAVLEPGKRIEDELRFFKPFKSEAKVVFEFAAEGDGTKATWHMYGSLPWFMFWMKSMMQSFIGMDYERGLRMLKERIETGEVLSQTTIHGVDQVGPVTMVGIRKSCAMKDIGQSMENAFGELGQVLADANLDLDGPPMTAYYKWDMKALTCEYTSGFIVEEAPANLPRELSLWSIDAANALRVEHVGSYEHLGNAWSAANQYLRYKKMKAAKVAAFEMYRNSPDDTPPAELRTDIYLPLK